MERIFPAFPVNPGFKTTPSKETVPAELEKLGSCAQSEKIELVFESDVTCNLSSGKEIVPAAAFIESVADETYTVTVNVLPTSTERLAGEK
jgi:hypothetical protein